MLVPPLSCNPSGFAFHGMNVSSPPPCPGELALVTVPTLPAAPLAFCKQDTEWGTATRPADRSPSRLVKKLLDLQQLNNQFGAFWKTNLMSRYSTREAGPHLRVKRAGGQMGHRATMPWGRGESKCVTSNTKSSPQSALGVSFLSLNCPS